MQKVLLVMHVLCAAARLRGNMGYTRYAHDSIILINTTITIHYYSTIVQQYGIYSMTVVVDWSF